MRIFRIAWMLIFLGAAAYPQTIDLGQGVFFNEEGDIVIAIDAGLVNLNLSSPYVMFMAYLAANGNMSLSVQRDDVVMIYQGQEYKMPTLKELRDKYPGINRDMGLYARLGKESLILSKIRNHVFTFAYDFFPNTGSQSQRPTDEGSLSGRIGFRTRFYFINPGFKKGDEIVFRVRDKKNPESMGQAVIILK